MPQKAQAEAAQRADLSRLMAGEQTHRMAGEQTRMTTRFEVNRIICLNTVATAGGLEARKPLDAMRIITRLDVEQEEYQANCLNTVGIKTAAGERKVANCLNTVKAAADEHKVRTSGDAGAQQRSGDRKAGTYLADQEYPLASRYSRQSLIISSGQFQGTNPTNRKIDETEVPTNKSNQ